VVVLSEDLEIGGLAGKSDRGSLHMAWTGELAGTSSSRFGGGGGVPASWLTGKALDSECSVGLQAADRGGKGQPAY
jgi:hypothetical protein